MSDKAKKTIRFNVYYNGDTVKLGLQDGESITLTSGGKTDEGYSYRQEVYSREGNDIFSEDYSSARDCDGCMQTEEFFILKDTKWERLHGSQRDAHAESMGY